MKIKDVMSAPAVCVSETTDVFHIAKIMVENNIGSVAVRDRNENICGVITDRDIVVRGVSMGRTLDAICASEIMTKDVVSVSPMTDLDDAVQIMAEEKIRRLPVVSDSRIVGMVTLGDLSQSLDYSVEISDTLCKVCEKN